jgi:two-component system, cell cycle sensor histidine kinase and response regulator CckA
MGVEGLQDLQGQQLVIDLEDARLQLARLNAGGGSRLREVWLELAQLAATALDVERVGVWILVDEGRAARCRYLLQRSSNEIFQGAVLRVHDFPHYFKALEAQRTITADDACHAPTTQELRAAYLEPLGITSMLDAPIFLDGQLVGVVCHEHVGPKRSWTKGECDFAGAVADNIARLYREHERHHAETTLQGYQRHLMELHRMEAVGRMAVGIAHDFRGIIGAALGFAELIRRTPDLPTRVEQYADRIVEALERGRRLTRDVMEFGKDDPVAPRVLDVGALIESNASMLRVLLGEPTALKLELATPLSRIFMDASQLERALLNLVLNARDAMPTGGTLTIAAADVEDDGEYGEEATWLMISVSDTGCGMDEPTRANAFKPFFTTKGETGTGLGLVIVDQIASRAGGFTRLDSTLGHGTTVRIYFPRIAAGR